MGKTPTSSNRISRRRRHLIIPMLMLLASSLFHAQGSRPMKNEYESHKGGKVQGVDVASMRRWLIGSSPPRCERRCSSCERCKAVQVPIMPQQQPRMTSRLFDSGAIAARIASIRGSDDVSNYKPMTWKCKCGNLLLNP